MGITSQSKAGINQIFRRFLTAKKSEAVQQEIRDAYGKQQDDQHIGEGGGQVIVAHVLE